MRAVPCQAICACSCVWTQRQHVSLQLPYLSDSRQQLDLAQAFVKLRGDGLAFDMSRVEFRLADGSAASNPAAYMDGKRLTRCVAKPVRLADLLRISCRCVFIRNPHVNRWTCTVQPLGDSHWVSVVRGPPDAVIDAWGVRRLILA